MAKRILYLSTTLPTLTQTFVYREIQRLSSAGYDIRTASLWKPHKSKISPEAFPLCEPTIYLDDVSLTRKLLCQCQILFSNPLLWLNQFFLAIREPEVRGIRDRARILYHFFEAGYLYLELENAGLHHIHAHFLVGPSSIALFLSRFLDIPFSFTMHASNIFVDPIMLKTKLLMCKKAVTVSEYNKRYLLSKYGSQFADKIKVIHCGIDPQQFVPACRTQAKPLIVLAVGQLVERKGFRFLVEACRLLKADGLDFDCRIVGDGPEMLSLRNQVRKSDLDGIVHMMGAQPQEHVRKLLETASVFVLPSIITDSGGREGIPVALMEAMAMELPVVSTRTAGIPELIENGTEGLLVRQREPRELAAAIRILLENPCKRREVGARARKKVCAQFNIDDMHSRFNPIFN